MCTMYSLCATTTVCHDYVVPLPIFEGRYRARADVITAPPSGMLDADAATCMYMYGC